MKVGLVITVTPDEFEDIVQLVFGEVQPYHKLELNVPYDDGLVTYIKEVADENILDADMLTIIPIKEE